MKRLQHEVKRAQPYKPELEQLAIIGQSYKKEEKVEAEKPLENVKVIQTSYERQKNYPIFIINGFKIFSNDSGTKEIRITHDFDLINQTLSTKYLNLQNTGIIATRIFWKSVKKVNLFADLIKPKYEGNKFIFNKTEIVIIPNRAYALPIWFRVSETGRFYEEWKLMSNPPLGINLNIIIQLTGISFIPNFAESCREIDEKLNKKLKRTIIIDIINSVLEQTLTYKKPTIYTYNKAKLFEAINSNFDPYQRESQIIYDKKVVAELNKFYAEVKLPHHLEFWNLDIQYLKFVTEEREVYERCKYLKRDITHKETQQETFQPDVEQHTVFPKLTTCEQMELEGKGKGKGKGKDAKGKKGKGKDDKKEKKGKDKKSKDSKKSNKKDSKKGKGSEVQSEPEIEPIMEIFGEPLPLYSNKFRVQLDEILSRLDTTLSFRNEQQEKYAYAHDVFVNSMNKLCRILEELKLKFNIHPPSRYPEIEFSPILDKSSRCRYEYFDEVLPPKTVFEMSVNLRDRPPPDILKEIPLEETEKRYKAYFNITEDTTKYDTKKGKGKGKGKKDKPGKKEKKEKNEKKEKKEKNNKSDKSSKGKKDKKGKKGKGGKTEIETEKEIEDVIDLDFDPYKTLVEKVNYDDFPIVITKQHAPKQGVCHCTVDYRYNLYILFYTYLEDIFMTIIEIFDDNKKVPSPAAIKKIETAYSIIQDKPDRNNRKLVNLDVISSLLCNDEDLTQVKEEFITAVKQYIKPEISVEKPDLNPYVQIGASLSNLCKCLQAYEKPPKPISDRKTFLIKRSNVPLEDRRDRFVDTNEVPLPPIMDAIVQTNITTFEKRIDFEEDRNEIHETKIESKPSYDNKFLSCSPSICSQLLDSFNSPESAFPDRAIVNVKSVVKIISSFNFSGDSKAYLIEKVLRKVAHRFPVPQIVENQNEFIAIENVLEVCEYLEKSEIIQGKKKDAIEEQQHFYDSDSSEDVATNASSLQI